MSGNIERVYSGLFQCRDCGGRYQVEDAAEDQLFCLDCSGELAPIDDDDVNSPSGSVENDEDEG